jgi:hypothetical protein
MGFRPPCLGPVLPPYAKNLGFQSNSSPLAEKMHVLTSDLGHFVDPSPPL